MTEWLPPTVLIALLLFVWRDLSARLDRVNRDLSARIDRINDRLDRHLENHPA